MIDKKLIYLNSNRISFILALISAFLILISTLGQFSKFRLGHDSLMGFISLFDLGGERNIPTFFSMSLMLLISLLLFKISLIKKTERDGFLLEWRILTLGFLFMSYDEAFQVHERLNNFRKIIGNENLSVFHFSWLIPFSVIVIILGLFFLKFIFSLPKKTRNKFLAAAFLYLGGAMGVEFIDGYYLSLHGLDNLSYNAIVTVEESLEMAGLITFIWSLLKYLEDNYKEVTFSFEKKIIEKVEQIPLKRTHKAAN